MSRELPGWTAVAVDGELVDGEIRAVSVGGLEMILCRVGESYGALERRCLHHGADLAEATIVEGNIVCPLHGWCYRAETGVHVQSPGNRLACYRVRVEAGEVQIWSAPDPGTDRGNDTVKEPT